jgi:prevent-host-death family protein
MVTTTITEAKNGLSALIDRVKGGQSVLILDRGVPVARLEPITSVRDQRDQPGRLDRLERSGVLRRGLRPIDLDRLHAPGPRLPTGVSAASTLIEERRTGR